jgi:hypothetical protein
VLFHDSGEAAFQGPTDFVGTVGFFNPRGRG